MSGGVGHQLGLGANVGVPGGVVVSAAHHRLELAKAQAVARQSGVGAVRAACIRS